MIDRLLSAVTSRLIFACEDVRDWLTGIYDWSERRIVSRVSVKDLGDE